MKIVKILTALCVLLLSACATENDNFTSIKSDPTGAFVQFEWVNRTCTTPCTIKMDRRLRATISKEGYKPQTFYIELGSDDMFIQLELIATSKDVESTALPDL